MDKTSTEKRGSAASADNPVDRRKHLRVPLCADVQLGSKDNFYAGRARDISAGGLFIETTAPLDVGTELGVRLQILDQTFVVRSEVCWVLRDRAARNVGVGVRFLYVPARMRESIAAFMERRAPIGFEMELPPAPPPLPARIETSPASG